MKVNNPCKFFPQTSGSPDYNEALKNATIMTYGDIIQKYSESGDDNVLNWHSDESLNDKWMKISFDGGKTFPLKFLKQFQDEIQITNNGSYFDFPVPASVPSSVELVDVELINNNACPVLNSIIENDPSVIIEKPELSYNLVDFIKGGYIKGVSLVRCEDDGASYMEITDNFSYLFIQDKSTGNLILRSTVQIGQQVSNRKYFLKIKLNNLNNLVAGVKIPVYANSVNAIPTVFDNDFGICNYLDKSGTTNKIILTSRFNNPSRVLLYIGSNIQNEEGVISLKVNFGTSEQLVTRNIGPGFTWVSLLNVENVSGEISIERLNNSSDTVNGTCIITNIIVESE